jgi:uncharacterized protein involved in type VI secretion and phage assembly
MPRTQEFRQLSVATPLGDDVLLLRKITGKEELGRLFEYELDLISENHDIRLEDIVGQNVTIRVQPSPEGEVRYFNGFVSRFALGRPMGGTMEYNATIVPWLWFLTRTSDCRIFQGKTVPEIVKEVFRGHGFELVDSQAWKRAAGPGNHCDYQDCVMWYTGSTGPGDPEYHDESISNPGCRTWMRRYCMTRATMSDQWGFPR